MSSYSIEEIKRIADLLKVDIDIYFEDIPIYNKTKIPKSSGIYILKNNNGERYIGVSGDICFRQLNHHIDNAMMIDIYLIEDINIAVQFESYLIYYLQPELNIYGKKYLPTVRKTYREKDPVIEIINGLIFRSAKNTIKMAIEDFKENEHIKQENDLLKREVERLKIENDMLKGKEKKGLREGLKSLIFK